MKKKLNITKHWKGKTLFLKKKIFTITHNYMNSILQQMFSMTVNWKTVKRKNYSIIYKIQKKNVEAYKTIKYQ